MKKLILACCLAAFCTCNAMAQEFNDAMFADSMMEDSTMVDSTIVEEFPLDNPVTQAILARRSIRKYLDKRQACRARETRLSGRVWHQRPQWQ